MNAENLNHARAGKSECRSLYLLILSCCLWAGQATGQVFVWGDNTDGQTNVPPSAAMWLR